MRVRLSELVAEVDERRPPDDAIVFSVSERFGVVPQTQLFTKKIATDDRSRYRTVRYGDIVYNPFLLWNRAVGACFDPRGGCVSPAYIVLRPRLPHTERFLHYLFRSDALTTAVDAIASGSVTRRRTAALSEVLALEFEVPSPGAQRTASALLESIDAKILENGRMIDTLGTMARSLYASWFIEFEPVRARASGGRSGLPPHLDRLFPDELRGESSSEMPAGWRFGDIYELADVTYGAPFKSEHFNEARSGLPLIRIRDLESQDPATYTTETASPRYRVRPGDLLVGMDGEFRAHLWMGPEGLLNQRVCRFDPKGNVSRAYVHYSIERPLAYYERSKTGTTVIHLAKRDIETFRVVVPPDAVMLAFGRLVEPIDVRAMNAASESRTLLSMRNALLPRLMSGRAPGARPASMDHVEAGA
jgi:type I restriction enzyme S subunit